MQKSNETVTFEWIMPNINKCIELKSLYLGVYL